VTLEQEEDREDTDTTKATRSGDDGTANTVETSTSVMGPSSLIPGLKSSHHNKTHVHQANNKYSSTNLIKAMMNHRHHNKSEEEEEEQTATTSQKDDHHHPLHHFIAKKTVSEQPKHPKKDHDTRSSREPPPHHTVADRISDRLYHLSRLYHKRKKVKPFTTTTSAAPSSTKNLSSSSSSVPPKQQQKKNIWSLDGGGGSNSVETTPTETNESSTSSTLPANNSMLSNKPKGTSSNSPISIISTTSYAQQQQQQQQPTTTSTTPQLPPLPEPQPSQETLTTSTDPQQQPRHSSHAKRDQRQKSRTPQVEVLEEEYDNVEVVRLPSLLSMSSNTVQEHSITSTAIQSPSSTCYDATNTTVAEGGALEEEGPVEVTTVGEGEATMGEGGGETRSSAAEIEKTQSLLSQSTAASQVPPKIVQQVPSPAANNKHRTAAPTPLFKSTESRTDTSRAAAGASSSMSGPAFSIFEQAVQTHGIERAIQNKNMSAEERLRYVRSFRQQLSSRIGNGSAFHPFVVAADTTTSDNNKWKTKSTTPHTF
jgi:hypothetical protein